MKLRTRLFFFALLPVLVQAAAAQTETLPQTAGASASTPRKTATVIAPAPDDASAGLADSRLQASQSAPILSLTEVVALALQDNPQRQENWAAYEAAQARIGTAKSAGGPQVNLNGSATTQRGFGFGSSTSTTTGTGNSGSTNYRRWTDNQELSLNANIPIYSGGKVKAGKRAAQYAAQAQFALARSFEQDLVYNTAITYLDILRGQQLLEVGDSNLAVARERRRIAGVRFDAGAAARLEVLRAETDLANARQTRISSSNALGQSMARLNTLMGREPETPLRIEPIVHLTLPEPLFTTSKASSVAGSPIAIGTVSAAPAPDLRTAAYDSRQSLAATRADIQSAEASVDVAKAAKKPSIGLDILGLIRNPVTFAGRFLLSVGASIAQNLFDSGRTSSQVREARAIVRQLRSRATSEEQAIANEIEQSLLLLDSSQKRLATADTGVVAAREALRAAQLGYSAGAQTSLEVSDAQSALLTAETDAVNARFDVAASQAQLSAAVGVYPAEAIEAYQSVIKNENIKQEQEKKKKK